MLAQLERIALFDRDDAPFEVETFEEVGQHFHSLGTANKLQIRVSLEHLSDERSVVGLHVVSHQIIRLATIECGLQVCLPRFALTTIGSIHYRNLLIVNEIGIITHAFRHYILTLKQIDVKIINTDVLNRITYHIHSLYFSLIALRMISPRTRASSDQQTPCRCCCECSCTHWQRTAGLARQSDPIAVH